MLERPDAEPLRVKLVEVSPPRGVGEPGRVVVQTDDFGGDRRAAVERFELPWPAPARLRPRRARASPDGLSSVRLRPAVVALASSP